MGRTLCGWEWGSCISLTTFPQSPSEPPTCICMCGMPWAHVKIHRRSWIPPLHTGHGLGDERCHASCDAASCLPGHGKQGGHGQNQRTTGSPLVSGFQAPYCVEPATWGGACSSDRLSSPLRGGHRTHAGVRAGEASPEYAAGA